MIDADAAIVLIESEFPDLASELHDDVWDSLLHPQIGVFSRLAQKFIDDSDQKSLTNVFAVALNLYENGNAAVINAINVSFLEHLNFVNGDVVRQWAYNEMPPLLRKAFDDMERHIKRIHGSV